MTDKFEKALDLKSPLKDHSLGAPHMIDRNMIAPRLPRLVPSGKFQA
jgi:hypothetical protein